jgi:hypothetical protein
MVVSKNTLKKKNKPSQAKAAKPKPKKIYTMSHPLVKELVKLSKTVGLSGKKSRNIPFFPVDWAKGTQCPTFRLYTDQTLLTTTGAGVLDTVFQIRGDNYLNMTDIAAVFDEYRPVRAELEYIPLQNVTAYNGSGFSWRGWSVGVVDYDDVTALTSYAGGLAYDTHKNFQIVDRERWNVKFDFVPDQEWTDTATLTTAFASVKVYGSGSTGLANSQDYGSFVGWCEFQFRTQK